MDPKTILWLAKQTISGGEMPLTKAQALEAAELLEARARECRDAAAIEGPRPNGNDYEAEAYNAIARVYRHPESWKEE